MKSAAIQVEMDEVGNMDGMAVSTVSVYPVLTVFASSHLSIHSL
jgi:hypothetical protein